MSGEFQNHMLKDEFLYVVDLKIELTKIY